MDLACELGTSADTLARTFTEGEFADWQLYARKRMLPQRRLELYLAQIAQMVAAHCGRVKDTKLTDYLFDPEPDDDAEPSADDEAAFFGFNPTSKG